MRTYFVWFNGLCVCVCTTCESLARVSAARIAMKSSNEINRVEAR